MEKDLIIYIDGKYYPKSQAKVSVYDHGLLYGDGVFEGIRAYDGTVFKMREHLDRLYDSARVIMLDIPLTKEEMEDAVLETLRRNEFREAYIRLVVTRGVGDLGLDPRKCPKPTVIIITDNLKLHSGKKGVKALIVWVKRDPVDATSHEVKSLNYMNSILGKIEANIANFDEAICLDKRGCISEGVAENLFIVKDGEILTPPTFTGALAGITRNTVINLCESLDYEVSEKSITPTNLFTADEAFFTGTAVEVVPLIEVNKRKIGNGKPGPITLNLMQEFRKLVRNPEAGVAIYQ